MSIFIICLSTSAGDPPQRRALLPQLSSSLQQLQCTISFFSLILRNVMKMVLSDFSLARKRAHSTPFARPANKRNLSPRFGFKKFPVISLSRVPGAANFCRVYVSIPFVLCPMTPYVPGLSLSIIRCASAVWFSDNEK